VEGVVTENVTRHLSASAMALWAATRGRRQVVRIRRSVEYLLDPPPCFLDHEPSSCRFERVLTRSQGLPKQSGHCSWKEWWHLFPSALGCQQLGQVSGGCVTGKTPAYDSPMAVRPSKTSCQNLRMQSSPDLSVQSIYIIFLRKVTSHLCCSVV
jgi:hypothetical protein